jgi:sugar phosphate isomerase/epimerase
VKFSILTRPFEDRPLEEVLPNLASLGYNAVEFYVQRGSRHFDLEAAAEDSSYIPRIRRLVEEHGLEVSALSNHLESALVLGPHDRSNDAMAGTSDPEEKVRWATERTKLTAQAAAELGAKVVVGLIGSAAWQAWYPIWPGQDRLWEEGFEIFAERWNPILDVFKENGVRFAHEIHLVSQAYNLETSERCLEMVDRRPEFGFNLDPSHLFWQGIDPVVVIKRLGEKIYYVHAKDGEVQADEVLRSGVLSSGSWLRPDRGFVFRVPGWGDLDWRRIMTALARIGYDSVLSYEHEDPVLSADDGCEQVINFLRPLVIRKTMTEAWW